MALAPPTIGMNLPQPGSQFLGPDGTLSRQWYYAFLALFQRTGGGEGVYAPALGSLITALQTQTAALQAANTARTAEIVALQAANTARAAEIAALAARITALEADAILAGD